MIMRNVNPFSKNRIVCLANLTICAVAFSLSPGSVSQAAEATGSFDVPVQVVSVGTKKCCMQGGMCRPCIQKVVQIDFGNADIVQIVGKQGTVDVCAMPTGGLAQCQELRFEQGAIEKIEEYLDKNK